MVDREPAGHRGIALSHSLSVINMLKWKATVPLSLVISISFVRSNEWSHITLDCFCVVPQSNTSVMHKRCVLCKVNQWDGFNICCSLNRAYYTQRDFFGGDMRVWKCKVNTNRYIWCPLVCFEYSKSSQSGALTVHSIQFKRNGGTLKMQVHRANGYPQVNIWQLWI